MDIINLQGIWKSFPDGENGRVEVLRDLSLSVGKGEFLSIMGESGAGKSTLLSILGTLLKPDSGTYTLGGENVLKEGTDLDSLRNRTIGFLFQDHRLLGQFTALENVLLPTLALRDTPPSENVEYAHTLMSMMGISSLEGHYPSTLSGGEAGRVALCRALVMKPLVLLADEPTGQLDSRSTRTISELLLRVRDDLGTTIVMVTHSSLCASYSSRILSLEGGVLHPISLQDR